MKLSVIVIPRISPSTAAAAAAQCQQVVPYTKPPFSSNKSNSIIHLAQKIPSIPPPIPPKTVFVFFFSLLLFLNSHILYHPIYFCVPVPVPVTCTSPYLTSPHLFLTNPSERNHSSQCVVEAFRFTSPHFSISARLFMLMGSVEVGFQCSKSTMDLVKKKEEKERDVRLVF